ncbi:MAG: hypothetical protein E3J72_20200 [Planctomycetota bacterium]|nr:MAG: hypothetical protein E3J72_20200 [Planctomycetota bacterium]
MKRYIAVFAIVFLLYAAAQADVIHMYDGRKITGRIVSQDDETVVVRARHGEITLDRDDIERIEKGKLPEEVYEEKAGALDKGDAQGHYELGLWCKENRLRPEAKKEFKKVIAADPDHKGARKELGHTKVEGKWLTAAQIRKRNKKKKKKDNGGSNGSSSKVSSALKVIENAINNGSLSDSDKKKLESFSRMSKKEFEQVATKIKAWKKYKPSTEQQPATEIDGMPVFVRVPDKYSPKKSFPVIIALHGAGGRGERLGGQAWCNDKTEWGKAVRAGYIVAAPTLGGADWWTWPNSVRIYNLLKHLKTNYSVDTNRVFVTGFSNGGHSTWAVGMKNPTLFAGLGPLAGGPTNEARSLDLSMLKNMISLPVFWMHNADDQICPARLGNMVENAYKKLGYTNLTHKQFPSGGHDANFRKWDQLFAWMEKQTRDLYSKKVVFDTDHAELDTAYWIRLDGISRRAKVTGEIDGSTIKLTVEKASRVTLFLSDKMLDLDKPIKVEVNGKEKFSGKVKRSAAVAVKEALKRNDRNAVFAAALELNINPN